MPKCADTDKQKISQYRWLLISEPIIGATLATCAPNFVEIGAQEHSLHTLLLSGAMKKNTKKIR